MDNLPTSLKAIVYNSPLWLTRKGLFHDMKTQMEVLEEALELAEWFTTFNAAALPFMPWNHYSPL